RMGNKTNMRLLGVALALASPLLAAEAAAERISGKEALAVMRSMDLSPELSTDGVGDPQINFVIDGLHARLNFYDCKKDGRCGSLQQVSTIDLADGTTYFVDKRFAKQYRYVRLCVGDEMDPYLQYDFEAMHADAQAHLRSQVEMFRTLL